MVLFQLALGFFSQSPDPSGSISQYAMEGSADDLGAPDSWDSADLEESMRRLMVSSSKKAADPSPPASASAPELVDPAVMVADDFRRMI